MNAQATYKLPHPLTRVELRAVRWQEVQHEPPGMVLPPSPVKLGMMVLGVVYDDHDRPPGLPAGAPQLLEELVERVGVEPVWLAAEHELAVAQPHRPEIPHTAPGRVV